MASLDLALGQVRWLLPDPRSTTPGRTYLIRIMGLSEHTVVYETWSDQWGWEIEKFCGAWSQFDRGFADVRTEYVRDEPLDERMFKKFRPDLVLCTSATPDWKWSLVKYDKCDDFEVALRNQGVDMEAFHKQPQVDIGVVTIIPIGPSGGLGRKQLIEAENGEFFTPIELLWKAHKLQSQLTSKFVNGVSLSRCGMAKRKPAYLCWEYRIE